MVTPTYQWVAVHVFFWSRDKKKFQSLEVVSRYRDTQLQVTENVLVTWVNFYCFFFTPALSIQLGYVFAKPCRLQYVGNLNLRSVIPQHSRSSDLLEKMGNHTHPTHASFRQRFRLWAKFVRGYPTFALSVSAKRLPDLERTTSVEIGSTIDIYNEWSNTPHRCLFRINLTIHFLSKVS